MLNNIIQQLSPEIIADSIRKNPYLVVNTLQKFETFRSFGAAMSQQQQLFLSNNIQSVNSFLQSPDGKEYIGMLLDAFEEYVEDNKKST